MIRSGTTCFADMYFEEAVADATVKAGMRALCRPDGLENSGARRGEF
jgi:hypothetical protein